MKTYAGKFYWRQFRYEVFMSLKFLPFSARLLFYWSLRSLACKKCNVRRFALHFFAFFPGWRSRSLSICSFALMQKNQKIKAVMPR